MIVGRQKDVIIRGGYNVYPREVEAVLYEHPAVADAAVVGLPSPDLGEEVGAAVALKPGARATPDELRDYVKRQVAAYTQIRSIYAHADEIVQGSYDGQLAARSAIRADARILRAADLNVSNMQNRIFAGSIAAMATIDRI